MKIRIISFWAGGPRKQVGIIIRNGRWETMDCMINEGDMVELFPVLSGG